MKKNSILLLLVLSVFANDAAARGGIVSEMMDTFAMLILGFGTVSGGAALYGGYKGYQSLKYHFSSTPEKIQATINRINEQICIVEKEINGDDERTPEERAELLGMLAKLETIRIHQAKLTLEHNIKKARE